MPFAAQIVDFFHFSGGSELSELQEYHHSMDGFVMPGIVGEVMNGYLLPIVCIFLLYNKYSKFFIINIILWTIAIVALFVVQQRTGFFCGVLFSMYIIYELIISRLGKHFKVLFFLLSVFLVVLGVYYGAEMLGGSDSRYALGADMSTRTDIYQKKLELYP